MGIQRGESQKTPESAPALETLFEPHDGNHDLVSLFDSVRTPIGVSNKLYR